jgi:DhnA family fructose-bisphosphate aldolase class Ia
MADGELSKVEQAIKAASDAVVADVVATVRQHPQYVNIVNDLVDKAIQALMSAV